MDWNLVVWNQPFSLLYFPEYSGINKEQRISDRSKTAHRKPPVKCFLTHVLVFILFYFFS